MKPFNKFRRSIIGIIVVLFIGCILVTKLILGRLDAQYNELQDHLANLHQDIDELGQRFASLETEKAYREQRLIHAVQSRQPIPNQHEDWFSYWVDNVDLLNGFLDQNPQLLIPEMELLVADDYLAAVQGLDFDSVADFNRAAARLRHSAKLKVVDDFKGALNNYLTDSEGELPQSIEEVADYLESPIAKDSLVRFEISQENHMYDGMRFMDDTIVLIEKPGYVDDTWSSQICYSSGGAVGYTEMYEHLSNRLGDSLSKYEEEHGQRAESLDDLLPYLGRDATEEKYRSRYSVIFDELHRPPVP